MSFVYPIISDSARGFFILSNSRYLAILAMPDEFIRFRHFFRDNGLLACWKNLYNRLTEIEKNILLKVLCDSKSDRKKLSEEYSENINMILRLYTINKSQFDRNEITAKAIIKKMGSDNHKKSVVSIKNNFPNNSNKKLTSISAYM